MSERKIGNHLSLNKHNETLKKDEENVLVKSNRKVKSKATFNYLRFSLKDTRRYDCQVYVSCRMYEDDKLSFLFFSLYSIQLLCQSISLSTNRKKKYKEEEEVKTS
jgi:hypothetical protein